MKSHVYRVRLQIVLRNSPILVVLVFPAETLFSKAIGFIESKCRAAASPFFAGFNDIQAHHMQ